MRSGFPRNQTCSIFKIKIFCCRETVGIDNNSKSYYLIYIQFIITNVWILCFSHYCNGLFRIKDACCSADDIIADTPQFRGGKSVYFQLKSVSIRILHLCIDVSQKRSRDSYRDAVCKKIATLCKKNRQPAAKNQNRSFTICGATVGLGIRL